MARKGKDLPARDLLVGDILQSVFPGSGEHIVTGLKMDWSDSTDPRVTVTTNHGEWTLNWEKHLTFPRREDGSVRNWVQPWDQIDFTKFPAPKDLAVGDIIQPQVPPPHVNEDVVQMIQALGKTQFTDLPEMLRANLIERYEEHAQRVTSIWANKFGDPTWFISAYDIAARVSRTYMCDMNLPLYFPRKTIATAGQLRSVDGQGRKIVQTYGPYLHPDTGMKLLLATHPFGRGRWPGDLRPLHVVLNDFDTPRGEYTRCRPPNWQHRRDGIESWDELRFIGLTQPVDTSVYEGHVNEPHPQDPIRRRP